MGANTKIEWCDFTFNPWTGCTKVSEGCAHCYAESWAKRSGIVKWGPGQPRRRTSASNWREPIKWNAEAAKAISDLRDRTPMGMEEPAMTFERPRVFCASLADWLDSDVSPEWLFDLLDLIRKTPNLDWLLLTKRPDAWHAVVTRARDFIGRGIVPDSCLTDDELKTSKWIQSWLDGTAPANVWIGTTTENQARAEERIPKLLGIPAVVRFLSCEPMLGPIDLRVVPEGKLTREMNFVPGIKWVIVGGESGAGSREFITEHAWDLVMQCRAAGVAVFVKQLGGRPVTTNINAMNWPEETVLENITAAAGGRVLLKSRKGADMEDWPEELQVREFPKR